MNQKLVGTKIVCTLGPASSSPEVIEQLIDAGMSVARLNFSHGEHETHAKNIKIIREISARRKINVGILQDLQGPKIRVGKLKEGKVVLHNGQKITFRFGLEQTDDTLPIDYNDLASDTQAGARILLDDGLLAMKVLEIKEKDVICEVIQGGVLKSRKGVNFPDSTLGIPSVTEKDMNDLMFGVSQKVDYMALSFVRTAEDVSKLKSTLAGLGADIPVVSKIEMLSAVENIDEICRVSDAIMVARGDLGVECGFPLVSAYQKRIVTAARAQGKPVIVATQMLDSMIENFRPTKSEISDVANAVFDLADATMLSGETASGKYPVRTVKTMRSILDEVDNSPKLKLGQFTDSDDMEFETIPEMFAYTAAKLAEQIKVDAVVCLSLTGKIAASVARHRPRTPIIAISPRPDIVHRLSLIRGVSAIQNTTFLDTDEALSKLDGLLISSGLCKPNDTVIITGGIPISDMKPTNMIKIHKIAALES